MDTSVMRRRTVTDWLETERLDALVAVGSGFNSFLDPNGVFVLSNFKPMAPSAVVVRRDGSSTLIVTPAWDGARAETATTTDATIACDDLVEEIGKAVAADGIGGDKVATEGVDLMPLSMAEPLEALFEGKARNSTGLIRHIARVRSEQEIARAEKASWIAERGYDRLLEFVKPGMHEYEMAAEIYGYMKALGGDDNFLLVSASQHNLAVRAPSNRVLEEGDIILGEITPSFEGQFVQICRTVALGKGPPGYDEKYAILQESMRRGQKAAVPGATMADVTEVMNGALEDAGYGDYCRPPYMRVRGHGLGLTSSLPGDVVNTNKTVLEAGMMFVMHPNQYIPETGYMMCGEPVVVTPTGARALVEKMAEPDRIAL